MENCIVLPYRHSVGVLVWSPDKTKILVVTNRKFGGYSCPGGKMEPGESSEEAAWRELYEETGVKALTLAKLAAIPHPPQEVEGGTRWFCTYFHAEIGDQIPTQVEEGTVPFWASIEELKTTSLFPGFYTTIFDVIGVV